jgi:hypothetical protein
MPAHRQQIDEKFDALKSVVHALLESLSGGIALLKFPHLK